MFNPLTRHLPMLMYPLLEAIRPYPNLQGFPIVEIEVITLVRKHGSGDLEPSPNRWCFTSLVGGVGLRRWSPRDRGEDCDVRAQKSGRSSAAFGSVKAGNAPSELLASIAAAISELFESSASVRSTGSLAPTTEAETSAAKIKAAPSNKSKPRDPCRPTAAHACTGRLIAPIDRKVPPTIRCAEIGTRDT
jgi:hypothetical protein